MTEFAEVADRLYAALPEDFMGLRTEQVAAAKKAGDKELAKRIGGLRKPTRSAWLVNLLARSAADDLIQLLDLGAALREAQQSLQATSLRTLSRERNKAVDGLSRRAVALGTEVGYQATETVRQEVAQSLQAALADPDTADLVRRGVLHQPVNYGGFGTLDLTPTPGGEPPPATADSGGSPEDAQDQTESAQRQAEREARDRAWQQAKDALAEAEVDAERATAAVEALDQQLEQLRDQLAETEQSATAARTDADEARRRVQELTAAERAARP